MKKTYYSTRNQLTPDYIFLFAKNTTFIMKGVDILFL